MSESEGSAVYEEHRGWTPRAIVAVSLCVLIGALTITGFLVTYRISLLVVAIVFVLGGVNLTRGAISRRLVLRVDANGITLAGQSRDPEPTVPWDQVQSVMLYQPRNIATLGVVKSAAGVPAPPLDPGLPDGPPTPDLSAALSNRRVDFERLKRVIAEVAPAVDVVDRR